MSAGGLTYSGLVNHGKITLPSNDGWGTNMNILRDPPKSIHTRRIDKVGDTSSITEMVDESNDRACEAIQVYARGVNPFVSVSYNNHGNNGGQRSGGIQVGGQQAAKLPYSIMKNGAFRPPVLTQEDLLPLSRMPRNWTSAYTKSGFADFSRKLRTCGSAEQTKEVHNETLKGCIRPTAVYQMETPINEPFEVKYVIQPTIKTSATSGIRTMDITQRHAGTPTKEIDQNPLHSFARTNYADVRHVDNNKFNPERYLQDTNTHAVATNASSNKHTTSIEDVLDLSDLPVRDQMLEMSANAPISGPEQTKYFHEEIELSRRLPNYQATTNIGDTGVYKRIDHENAINLTRNMPMNSFVTNPNGRSFNDHSSREVRLAPKIQPGGYSIPGQVPMTERTNYNHAFGNSEKGRMNKMVAENMQGRFERPGPFGAPISQTTPIY